MYCSMSTDDCGRNFFDHQVNEMTERYSRSQVNRLKQLLEAARDRESRAIDIVINIGLVSCPDQLNELQSKYPSRPLNEFPLEDLEKLITLAVRMMRSAQNNRNTDDGLALKKLEEDISKLKSQLRNETHLVNEYKQQLSQAKQLINNLQNESGKKKLRRNAIKGFTTSEDPFGKEIMNNDDHNENNPVPDQTVEDKALPLEFDEDQALARFKEDWENNLSFKGKRNYGPLLTYIGSTGDCFKQELTEELCSQLNENYYTIKDRLYKLVTKFGWLESVKLKKGDADLPGTLASAFVLTPVGKMGYYYLTGKMAQTSKLDTLNRFGINPSHSFLINSIVKAFERIGWSATIETKRIWLPDQRHFDPDITITDGRDGNINTYYLEVETAGHIRDNKLYSKWRNSTEVQNGAIYLGMKTKKEAKDLAYSVIRYWMTHTGFDREVMLFTTSLEYLMSLNIEDHPSPWSEVRTLIAQK